MAKAKRKATSTSAFGVGRRESHDSSDFYARFTLPKISDDSAVATNPPEVLDQIYEGDSADMRQLESNSVALVVTSPPYFVGKQYEASVGQGHTPATYVEYLEGLWKVFEECKRVLEPGGRIAVNVANLGRKPYRSLAADVIDILQNRLGLLLRGEIIWVKAQAAGGSCAWGSFRSPANPVLRDVSERIIVASKGRFDRAMPASARSKAGLPAKVSILKDDFMEFTTDVWEFPPESAHRVGHPAPFPVELPHRLIQLYTYEDDVVVDPFIGSGSTAVAAARSNRRYVGYDIDKEYVVRARERAEQARLATTPLSPPGHDASSVSPPAGTSASQEASGAKETSVPAPVNTSTTLPPERSAIKGVPVLDPQDFHRRAVLEGRRAKELAREVLEACGFADIQDSFRFRSGAEINFLAHDRKGNPWLFDVSGAFTSTRPGLKRTDTVWKALGKAAVLKAGEHLGPLILLTTDLPDRGSAYDALRSTRGVLFHDAIDIFSSEGLDRLRTYATGAARTRTKPIGDLLQPRPKP